MRLPRARGLLSRCLLTVLTGPVRRGCGLEEAAAAAVGATDSVLSDDDVQLGLLLVQELSHDGLDGVDDQWERSPDVVSARAVLEDAVEAELRAAVALSVRRALPDARRDLARTLFDLCESSDGASLAGHIRRRADLEQFREFLAHRSIYQLREADPHTWLIPRLNGTPKAALVEVQTDEYGGGRLERMHSQMFADTMALVGMETEYGHYLDRVPATTLALTTTVRMLGQQRRLRGAAAGHLAAFEATSSLPNRRIAQGVRRLGLGDQVAAYFDEHVEADAVHEQLAARDLCGGLVRQEPQLLESVLFGAATSLLVDARAAATVLDAWAAGISSLRPEQPADLPDEELTDRLGVAG